MAPDAFGRRCIESEVAILRGRASKVPEVTALFWMLKIAATTLGETGGDSVTMTLHWGYLAGTALFAVVLLVLVTGQILAARFHASLYWATIIATTTFRHDNGGFCRPVARRRVHGRFGFAAGLPDCHDGRVVFVAGHGLGAVGAVAEG